MAKLLTMPKLSPTMEEGQIGAWYKKEGDKVGVDEHLADVETDKATMEFRSFDAGTLLKILAPAGSVVKLGDPVAVLGNPGEDPASVMGAARAPAAAPSPGPAKDAAAPSAPAAAASSAAPATAAPSGRTLASPYVRKIAREQGLSLTGVVGSGPNGRIVAKDLSQAGKPGATQGASATSASSRGRSEARPLSMMRKAIARRLTESKTTVPHFYLSIDVDAGALVALREQLNQDLKAQSPVPMKVSINDLIVKACAAALVRVPECNAQFTPDAIIVHHRVDISVAVAVPEGLVTPVIRDADQKGVTTIAGEIRDLAERAKSKKLRPEEMADGTFSISNLGMFDIDHFAAVINPPEGAILAVGRVRDEAIVRNGGLAPGKKLALTLSCDHRVVDGAVGATFLKELRKLLEHPHLILLS